jgi:hypothetical protein
VTLCQERLCAWNYPVDVDGYFGPATETAVIEFQSDHALVPDGIVGSRTWDVLLSAPGGSVIPAPPYDALSTRMLTEIAWYVGWDYTDFKAPGAVALVARGSRLAPAGVTWAKGKQTDTVCCVFLGGVVGCVYDTARGTVPAAAWTPKAWSRFMVPADEPWGMITESVAAGIGTEFHGTPVAGAWYLVQGWSGLVNGAVVAGSKGHQWLQWGPDLMAEATTYTDENADGYSTDPGAVAWRHRAWSVQAGRFDTVRLVALR